MKKVSVTIALLLALAAAGCTTDQQNQIIAGVNTGLNVIRGVSCVVGGNGGALTQKIEAQVKANNAWVGTTGDIVAVSSDICVAMGGTPGAPQSVITK